MRHQSHSRTNDSYLQKSALSSVHAPPSSPGFSFARFRWLLSVLFAIFEFDQHRVADVCCSRLISRNHVGDGRENLLLLKEADNFHCRIRFGVCGIQNL